VPRQHTPTLNRTHTITIVRRLARSIAVIAALLLATAALADATLAAAASRNDHAWILATDIHLDPTGKYGRGTYGNDSNPALLASAIRAMQQADPNPPVITLGGDFLAHVFAEKSAVPTMRAIARQFDRAFPRAQFILVLGNEDSNCGDYRTPAGTSFLRDVAQAWEPLVNRHGAAPNFVRTFASDGFYTATLPAPGLRAVVLDDVFWSPRYRSGCGGTARPAVHVLHELDAALHASPRTKTWVFVHIPPGIDAFSTAHLTQGLIVVPFLDPGAKDAFVRSITAPPHDVALVVAAHTHKFAFRVAGDGRDAVPMLLVPSVSPIFRNAPSFLTVRLGAANRIVSAEDWTRIDGRWADRGGLATLGIPNISASSIRSLETRMATDANLRASFARLYNGGAPPEITDDNWRIYACAASALTATAFRACTAQGGFSILTARAIAIIATVVAVFVVLIVVVIRRVRRRVIR
jgi:sphingomyelin phosphodiesterase acid-like 3